MTYTLTGMINTERANEADKSISLGTPKSASNGAGQRIDRHESPVLRLSVP